MHQDLCGTNVLVTGGSGFLGSHLLPLLLAAGANVTCLVRQFGKAHFDARVRAIQGDCLDPASISQAVIGQDIIIHMAAVLFGHSWHDYLAANSTAALNLAMQASQNIKRIIFVSSLAAAGPCNTPPGKRESEMPMPVSAYGWSKLMAEQILARAYKEKLVIMRPPIIYGSGDRGLLPLFKSCAAGFGINPGIRRFPVSAIHAHDAARAILLATSTKANGTYHLSDGRDYAMTDICKAMGKAAGRARIRILSLPLPLMAFSAAISSAGSNLWRMIRQAFGPAPLRGPGWNLDKYRESRQPGWLACADRIKEELGFTPDIDLEQGMNEAYTGYKKAGWL